MVHQMRRERIRRRRSDGGSPDSPPDGRFTSRPRRSSPRRSSDQPLRRFFSALAAENFAALPSPRAGALLALQSSQSLCWTQLLWTRSTSPAPLAGDASFEPEASVRVNLPDAAQSDELQRARVRAAPRSFYLQRHAGSKASL